MAYTQDISLDGRKLAALTNLVIDNLELNRLESILSEFNLFEAIGVIRQELKHSSLLAFLLSPRENHGLGDRFLKRLLSTTFTHTAAASPLSALDIDLADLSDVEVRREWRHIDLLIYSPSNRWVIAIENKVDSGEHGNQLERYEEAVESEFSDYDKKAFVFLTKEGDEASRDKWLSLSYSSVADILEIILANHRSSIGNDVSTLIHHYINLIRRHLVSDSEIAQLCRKIYKQHHQALTLIYEHRLDIQLEIADFLKQIIKETEGIEQEDSTKLFIRCVPTVWDAVSLQKMCSAQWTKSKRLVMFEFFNYADRLEFKLTIGPGEIAHKQAVYNAVKGLNISGAINSQLNPDGYSPIFCQDVLTAADYFEEDWQGIQNKISEFWQNFNDKEMPEIRNAFNEIDSSTQVSTIAIPSVVDSSSKAVATM